MKPSGKTRKLPSGSGSNLQALPSVGWEAKKDGAVEAWHSPPGATKRTGKTYLGRIGKRLLADWEKLSPDDKQKAVEQWIRDKRTEKGITQ